MGTAATILLPQISRPGGSAWSSGLAGAFEIPYAHTTSPSRISRAAAATINSDAVQSITLSGRARLLADADLGEHGHW